MITSMEFREGNNGSGVVSISRISTFQRYEVEDTPPDMPLKELCCFPHFLAWCREVPSSFQVLDNRSSVKKYVRRAVSDALFVVIYDGFGTISSTLSGDVIFNLSSIWPQQRRTPNQSMTLYAGLVSQESSAIHILTAGLNTKVDVNMKKHKDPLGMIDRCTRGRSFVLD